MADVAVTDPTASWHPAEVDGRWLRPVDAAPAEPRWGHPDGLQVALPPTPGPRGLLRIFTPYLEHPRDRLVNFLAVEPIPRGVTERGYSELEHSAADGLPGKRMWSGDVPGAGEGRHPVDAGDGASTRGTVTVVDGVEQLTVGVGVETFDNGARVSLQLRFRADRPHEVGVAAFRLPGSVELDRCVLSATMGNWARLRRLELADGVVTPEDLWPDFDGDHFTPHGRFGLDRFRRTPKGDALVLAVPDEDAPVAAVHDPATKDHWRYIGAVGRQTWRVADPDPALVVQVNGRHV